MNEPAILTEPEPSAAEAVADFVLYGAPPSALGPAQALDEEPAPDRVDAASRDLVAAERVGCMMETPWKLLWLELPVEVRRSLGAARAGLVGVGALAWLEPSRDPGTSVLCTIPSGARDLVVSCETAGSPSVVRLPLTRLTGEALRPTLVESCFILDLRFLPGGRDAQVIDARPRSVQQKLWARVRWAAFLAGVGRHAVDMTVERANEREQFGCPLASHQAVRLAIARSQLRLASLRAGLMECLPILVALPSNHSEAGEHRPANSGAARLVEAATQLASEVATSVAEQAVHLHGAYGLTVAGKIEAALRTAYVCGGRFGHPKHSLLRELET